MTSRLVGRSGELAALVAARADAGRGAGRAVLVTGEAGIGKTTLVEALVTDGLGRGVATGVGRAWEGTGAPPWWIWREALRTLGVELVLPRTLADDEARFACFETITEAVREVAASNPPLVLVLDDLQWADVPSILATRLLARVVGRLPVLVVGTIRDPAAPRPDVDAALVELRRDATLIALPTFTRDEVASLVQRNGLEPIRAADGTFRISGGNPLLATRLLEDPGARDDLAAGREPSIPRGLTELLGRQLDALRPREREIVEWAAVAGDPLDQALIVAASGVGIDVLSRGIEGARRAGVLAPSPPARFVHDLFRHAAYAGIDPARRARMHLDVARALCARGDNEAPIADHLFAADPDGAGEDVAGAASAAAAAALGRLAYEEATAFAERAVRLEERAGRTGAVPALLTILAEARMHAGDAAGSVTAAEQALARLHAGGGSGSFGPSVHARAALALGLRRTVGLPDRPLIVELEGALSALDRGGVDDVALRCAVEARLGAALQPMTDPPRALALARAAIERARRSGNAALLARTIHDARPAFRLLEPFAERSALDRELLALAEERKDANLEARAHGRLFWLAIEAGEPLAADLHLAEWERLAAALRIADHEVGAASARAVRALMCGEWDEGERTLAALETSRAHWSATASTRLPADHIALIRARVAVLRGDPGSAAIDAAIRGTPPLIRPLYEMVAQAQRGEHAAAKKALASLEPILLAGDPGFAVRTALGETAIALRDGSLAAKLEPLLAPWSGRHAVGTPFPSYDGAVDRLLAGFAALGGDRARAERLYAAAVQSEEALGALPYAARTERERAEILGGASAGPRRAIATALTLVHEGDTWRITFGSEETRVRDAVGLHYIAFLLARPDTPVAALELFAARAPLLGGDGAWRPSGGDAGTRLDRAAISAYRERAGELREMLAAGTDHGRHEAARLELELLEDELRAAVGLGGRSRRVGSDAERVRVSVTTRIRKAIERLRERAPGAAHHLGTAIRTGTTCVYRCAPATRVTS